ncbi:MAG: DUF1844 domain-containing protein [Candidatus Polarisedimenticolia bacterium]
MSDKKESARPQEVRVIDRRMFTPEGAPRMPDAPPEDATHPAPPPPESGAGRATSRRGEPVAGAGGVAASREEQVATAHFKNLVLNLATTAAANLGEIPNPFSRQTEIDLEGARQVIDLLQALGHKTRGNLSPEEQELLDSLLFDLKSKFVALQSKAPKAP